MRLNEYDSFEKFYDEYNFDRDINTEHYTGIEFKFNDKYYRLSHDFSNNSSEKYKYWVYELISKDKNVIYLKTEWTNVGKFLNLDDVLDNWIIDNRKFREVIMDDNTIILGKD